MSAYANWLALGNVFALEGFAPSLLEDVADSDDDDT